MPPKKRRVREPVQVYLDEQDRELLEQLASRTSLSRAELLRLGVRRLSQELLAETPHGGSLDILTGVLDGAEDVPPDLAERHDHYLYGDAPKRKPRRG
jgi:hypothetical protein